MADEEKKVEAVEQTPEEKQAEVNVRAQAFVKEYGELVEKHKIDFASYPMYVPDGSGGFKVTVQNTPVDITNQPKKSPFVAQ